MKLFLGVIIDYVDVGIIVVEDDEIVAAFNTMHCNGRIKQYLFHIIKTWFGLSIHMIISKQQHAQTTNVHMATWALGDGC